MQVSLREFELFVTTLELGTLSAAADALNMSQPAASKMLRTFEERLGVELFEREKKRLIPTQHAYELFPELEQVLRQVSAILRRTHGMKDRHQRQIEIVTNPAVASNIMPGAVALFLERFPSVNVIVRTRTTIGINELLTRDQADLAVVYDAAFDAKLHPETIAEERIGCLLHPDHPLGAMQDLTAQDLVGQRLIALGRNQPVGAAFRRMMREHGIDLNIAIEVSQSNTACGFVGHNLGIAILDSMGLAEGRARGLKVLPLRPDYTVRLSLVHSANRLQSRPLSWMAACIRTYVASRASGSE